MHDPWGQNLVSHFFLKDNTTYFRTLIMTKMNTKRPLCRSHSHPLESAGSSYFFGIKWKPIFFYKITPNFQLQIHYTLEVIAGNVPISGIPRTSPYQPMHKSRNFLQIFCPPYFIKKHTSSP